MKNSQPSSKFHIFAISTGAVLVGIFLWSTLNTFAFIGPTANPPTGNGALSSDSSNNVYISGNLNVTGTITSANNFSGDISAANISPGTFGSSLASGTFTFGADGVISYGGFVSQGATEDGFFTIEDASGDFLNNDNTGDFVIYGQQAIDLGAGSAVATDLTIASSGNVGIGTLAATPPAYLLTVNGTTSAAAYCISGANCITAWPGGGSGANPTASIGTSAVNGSATTFMRSDAAPAINQAATFAFSALGNTTSTGNISALTFKENGTAVSTSTGANPSGSIGTSAVNGSANTFMRSDAAPAINQAATFTFSALGNTTSTGNITAASLSITGAATTASTIATTGSLGKCASSSVTISGATSTVGAVFVAPVTYPGVGLYWDGYVSAANTVVIMECAATTTTVTASKFNAVYVY